MVNKRFGHRLAEEDDIGFDQVRLTDQTLRRVKAGHDLIRQRHVAIGADLPRGHLEMRVLLTQPPIELGSRCGLATVQTPGHLQVSVQLENVMGTGHLMQPIHVLGDDRANQTQALKIRNRAVSVIGPGAGKPTPSHEAARPITLPIRRRGNELAIRHGHDPPLAVRTPVVRDA